MNGNEVNMKFVGLIYNYTTTKSMMTKREKVTKESYLLLEDSTF